MKKSTLLFGGSIAAIALAKSGVVDINSIQYYLPQIQNALNNLFK
ncbi:MULTISPECIES: hypothetical protein [unclassified Lactobacillus]|nr:MULTISPECIES: hypothetical protein [unclassified Lactobacillus]